MVMLKKMYDLQKKKGKKGFSMIELIIVIAIMAILIALIGTQLLPYLEKSREKRDMTTLDTILTATQSVISENELTDNVGNDKTITQVLGSDTDVTNAFKSYSGLTLDATPFKSKSAGKSSKVQDVKLIVTGTGANAVITGVKINGLTASRDGSKSNNTGGSESSSEGS
jgi:type IV pilus assembly protein PilA